MDAPNRIREFEAGLCKIIRQRTQRLKVNKRVRVAVASRDAASPARSSLRGLHVKAVYVLHEAHYGHNI